MGRTFKYNKVYHSYLKNSSPIVLQFKGPVKPSDYNDDDIAFIAVRGDDHDKYYLIVENEDYLALVDEVPKKQWLKCTFTGEKETATFTWEETDFTDAPPATSTSSGSSSSGQRKVGNYQHNYLACVNVAKDIVKEEFEYSDELVKDIATTLFINWSYSGFRDSLTPGSVVSGDLDSEFADEHELDALSEGLNTLLNETGKSHDGKNLKPALDKIRRVVRDGEATTKSDVGKMLAWLSKEYDWQVDQEGAASVDDYADDLPF